MKRALPVIPFLFIILLPSSRARAVTLGDLTDFAGKGRFRAGFQFDSIRRDIRLAPTTFLGSRLREVKDEATIRLYTGRFTFGVSDRVDFILLLGGTELEGFGLNGGLRGVLGAGLRLKLFETGDWTFAFQGQFIAGSSHERTRVLGIKTRALIDIHEFDFALGAGYRGFKWVVPYAAFTWSPMVRWIEFEVRDTANFSRDLEPQEVLGGVFGLRFNLSDRIHAGVEGRFLGNEVSWGTWLDYKFDWPGVGPTRDLISRLIANRARVLPRAPTDTIGKFKWAVAVQSEFQRRDLKLDETTILGRVPPFAAVLVPKMSNEFHIFRLHGRVDVGITEWFDFNVFYGTNSFETARFTTSAGPSWGAGARFNLTGLLPSKGFLKDFGLAFIFYVVDGLTDTTVVLAQPAVLAGREAELQFDLLQLYFIPTISYKGFKRVVPYAGLLINTVGLGELRVEVPSLGLEFAQDVKADSDLGGLLGVRVNIADRLSLDLEGRFIDEFSFFTLLSYRF